MLDIHDGSVDELKKFSKAAFDIDQNLNAAMELKYTKEIKRIMAEQFASPSEELVRLFASQIYTGKLTAQVRQQFSDLTKRALHQFVSERISDRLKSALAEESVSGGGSTPKRASETSTPPATRSGAGAPADRDDRVVTTGEELEAFYIVKAMLREKIDARRIYPRDTMSYFGVLLDDTNRKPICRFRFNGAKKYLCLINQQKDEERVPLEDLDDLYQYAGRLEETIGFYESPK